MAAVTPENLAGNPFRVLGLPAGATQAEVDSAARRLRIFQDPADIPPTPCDFSWLGGLDRSSRSIESAVAALADPLSRLHSRLWWFCAAPEEIDHAGPALAAHDTFLHTTGRTLLEPADAARWQQALNAAAALQADPAYAQWLDQVEADGDFEKPSTAAERDALLANIARDIAAAAIPAADRLIDSDNIDGVLALLATLRRAGPAAADTTATLIDRIEDALVARCNRRHEEIDLAWAKRNADLLRPVCQEILARFNREILPLVNVLYENSGDDDGRRSRARLAAARLLGRTGEAYAAVRNYVQAHDLYTKALTFAQGTSLSVTIKRLRDAVHKEAVRQRSGQATFREAAAVSRPRPALAQPAEPRRRSPIFMGVVAAIIGCIISAVQHQNAAPQPSALPRQDLVPRSNLDVNRFTRSYNAAHPDQQIPAY